jgi:predicted nucleic acid-binding protein
MRPLTCLDEACALIVADTSVAINLNATGCAAQILDALPYRIAIVDTVQSELEFGRSRGRTDGDKTATLISSGHIKLVSLGATGLDIFEQLVVGSAAATLDDGEAATLAHAMEKAGAAVIDERKALRLAAERYPELLTASTMDLLGHPSVCEALGDTGLSDAIYLALRDARMGVCEPHKAWVVEVIGAERASRCRGLKNVIKPSRQSG